MGRRRPSEDRQRDAARQAAQRMIARGERPGYRLRPTEDGCYAVLEAPWLSVDRRGAARGVLAAWLECDPEAFDLKV